MLFISREGFIGDKKCFWMLIYAIIIHVSPVTVDFTLLYHARLQSSQLHVELDNQIANFEIHFPTSARSKFTIHNSPNEPVAVWGSWHYKQVVWGFNTIQNSAVIRIYQERQM